MKNVMLILISIIVSIMCFGSGDNLDSKKTMEKYEAKVYAEIAIKQLLKSPKTARFSNIVETKFTALYKDGLNGFLVKGFVDSQNGFGAMIRSNYSIEVYQNSYSDRISFKNPQVGSR